MRHGSTATPAPANSSAPKCLRCVPDPPRTPPHAAPPQGAPRTPPPPRGAPPPPRGARPGSPYARPRHDARPHHAAPQDAARTDARPPPPPRRTAAQRTRSAHRPPQHALAPPGRNSAEAVPARSARRNPMPEPTRPRAAIASSRGEAITTPPRPESPYTTTDTRRPGASAPRDRRAPRPSPHAPPFPTIVERPHGRSQ